MTHKEKKHETINMLPSVSIITVNQLSRHECLVICAELVKSQTYTNIIEWVIVEGSKNKADADKNSQNIKLLQERLIQEKFTIPIIYVPLNGNIKLGELRNIGNNTCKGDITVCMDDDDFYFSTRVSHAVDKLSNSPAKIAGCSAILMYDYILNKLYKFNQLNPNHSTNTAMAWKKAYLLTNQHDNSKEFAEEMSFTKNFTEPMVQLEAEKTFILSSHSNNTFNKREICTTGSIQINPMLFESQENIYKYINQEIHNKYKTIFVKPKNSDYDIVYFCGGFSIDWNPTDMKLGGSEQAVVNLTNNWVKIGKKVAVYGKVVEQKYNDVDYIDWKKFPFEQNFNIVILWRLSGLLSMNSFKINASKIWLDVHDTCFPQFVEAYNRYGKLINKIFLKSDYHAEVFKEKINFTNFSKCIIPNGVRIEQFQKNNDIIRNPYRFCYCSCYTRGLKEIIEHIWPIIYNYEPKAELHVYYGMDQIQDINFKNYLQKLLSSPGIMDHGRQPMDIIIREKYMSNFQLYITNTIGEIDCISIRESLATGCIPLISNFGVFKEREGIHFDLIDGDNKSYGMIAIKIIQLLKDLEKMNEYREKNKSSLLLIDWQEVANKWLING